MGEITFEIIFIVILLIANGVFSMSEMAVVSARKARLQKRAGSPKNVMLAVCKHLRLYWAFSKGQHYIFSTTQN
jgi:putative hemolysin